MANSTQAPKVTLDTINAKLDSIQRQLKMIQAVLPPYSPATELWLFCTIGGITERVTKMKAFEGIKKFPMSVAIVDKAGKPAKVDGLLAWSISRPECGRLKVAEDGMSADMISTGEVGAFSVKIEGDADLGEGIKPLVAFAEFECLPGEAISLMVTVGEGEDVPAEEPAPVEPAPEA